MISCKPLASAAANLLRCHTAKSALLGGLLNAIHFAYFLCLSGFMTLMVENLLNTTLCDLPSLPCLPLFEAASSICLLSSCFTPRHWGSDTCRFLLLCFDDSDSPGSASMSCSVTVWTTGLSMCLHSTLQDPVSPQDCFLKAELMFVSYFNVVGAGLMGTILLWFLPTQKCSCTSDHTIEHGWIVENGSWSLILLLGTSLRKSERANFTTSWTWDSHHSISTQDRFKQSKWCLHMLTRWTN